jgi:MFS transporter, AAHS family, benzoate transport protein
VPLAWKFMPESISFLMARGRRREAVDLARRFDVALEPEVDPPSLEARGEREEGKLAPVAGLFRRNIVTATLLFWVIAFLGLLLIYGINTWLPEIMRKSGYSLGSALSFLLVLNVGAIAGALVAGALADRFGNRRVTTAGFAMGAGAIFLLSLQPPLVATYVLLAVAGLGSIGTMILVNAYVMEHYAVRSRATALGWALGVGRAGAICGPLVGGFILSSELGVEANFYVFAVAGILAAVLCSVVPTSPIRRAAAEGAARARAAARRPQPRERAGAPVGRG